MDTSTFAIICIMPFSLLLIGAIKKDRNLFSITGAFFLILGLAVIIDPIRESSGAVINTLINGSIIVTNSSQPINSNLNYVTGIVIIVMGLGIWLLNIINSKKDKKDADDAEWS